MTGLPLPNVATNAVGMSATPRVTLKPAARKLLLQQRAALLLLVSDFGEAPDLLRDVRVRGATRFDALENGVAIVGRGERHQRIAAAKRGQDLVACQVLLAHYRARSRQCTSSRRLPEPGGGEGGTRKRTGPSHV